MATRTELLNRLLSMQHQDDGDPLPSKHRDISRAKEQWFSDCFDFLINQPEENHIWCCYSDLMEPLLETFHNYFNDKRDNKLLRLIWTRVSKEMGQCTQCICRYHQALETYRHEYEAETVDPLLRVLNCLDEERVAAHLKEVNARIGHGEPDPDCHSAIVSLMFEPDHVKGTIRSGNLHVNVLAVFLISGGKTYWDFSTDIYEVLMFPLLLDDQSLVSEFQIFIERIDEFHEVTLAGNQQYPGVYALLFLPNGRARAIGHRLARSMGTLRRAADLEPMQPLLKKYIGLLELEVLPKVENLRPRVQLERINVWLGIKTLLAFLEAPAFEEGILERYPVFLNIVLNHVSDDTPEFSYAVTCLKASFEMLGCKLWLQTVLSPSMMRNTLLGQCFHTRNEKSHKEIFDLFLPLLQSLEALQDGEHENQRRHFLYFLLHQVPHSSNFSFLMRKNACKIALLIIHRGYTMDPPSPPFECAHMWGPSLVSSLKDTSLHSSLRQPSFDLVQTIIVADASALMSLKLKTPPSFSIGMNFSGDFLDDEDELPFSHDVEETDTSCWSEFSIRCKITSRECKQWICIPMLWLDALVEIDPSTLPISFSKAVFWSLSHASMLEPDCSMKPSTSMRDWLLTYASDISSAFEWQIPNGSDDGDGMVSRNSVKASSMCTPLIRTFKRFAAYFILQVKQNEFHEQWTWEPRMAESLILLLIDPNDVIRQTGRVILEHVSKTKGLTPGLQFLCSSAYSLSAIFFGMRYAAKQVQTESLLNCCNLQHLLFVMFKLLKEVVESPPKSSINSIEDSNCPKFLSEGGFLRQPSFNQSPSGHSLVVVDMKSWEKFSFLLSAIMWPCMLKCLAEGKKELDNKVSQIACIRLLEILPVTFERLSSSSRKVYQSSLSMTSVVAGFTWLHDLLDWGRSSVDVISRYWQKCILSVLKIIKDTQTGVTSQVGEIESIVTRGNMEVDQLKERVHNLTISLSTEASCTEGKTSKSKALLPEISFGNKISLPYSFHKRKDASTEGTKTLPNSRDEGNVRDEGVIVLSDDEMDKMEASGFAVSSSDKSVRTSAPKALLPSSGKGLSKDNHMTYVNSSLSRGSLKPSRSGVPSEHTQVCSRKRGDEVLHDNIISDVGSPVSGSTSAVTNSKGDDSGKVAGHVKRNVVKQRKESNFACKDLPNQHKHGLPSSGMHTLRVSGTVSELETEDQIIKEIISDHIDDPVERALDSSRRPPSVLTKTSSVPKRKVIQLQMPDNSGSVNQMHSAVRRLKPAKLDEWFRSILELNYFAIVGLSSNNKDDKPTSLNLQEVPLSFKSHDQYVQIFRPLVLEEFKAQLYSSYMDTSSDDTCCGSLCVISVERIDDFLLVQGRLDDAESAASRGFLENDLVLLTKEPLQNSVQRVHVLGKVERRENFKSRSTILVIRFYLPDVSSRLNTTRRLLTERSKWSLNRLMSITSQLREFQALSSLRDIPMLPIILNPVDSSLKHSESTEFELSKLSQPMQEALKSSFNKSQLQAISVAIRSLVWRRNFELSLIQGPPGTGKTRTIVAIVSALLALYAEHKNSSYPQNSCSGPVSSNRKIQISQDAAVARAWQDAAFARQMVKNAEKNTLLTGRPAKGRILICAQSNAAVDELVSRVAEGIYGHDGKLYKPYLVRVGNAKTIHPNSLPYFIDTIVEQRVMGDTMNSNDTTQDQIVESSSLLRARLEKLVDSIRHYESKRAKIEDRDPSKKASPNDWISKEDDSKDMSDAELGAKLNILYGKKREICRNLAAAQAQEKKISEESRFLKQKIRKSILREAEIVVTTLSGCGGDLYGVCSESASSNRTGTISEQTLFDVVVIDEAAQALEPATLIPLQLLKSHGAKCIMVGDPKQLPATVLSSVASKFLYECSMFERLQRAGHPVIMLTEQYRMHPEICRFPALHFYEDKLLNGSLMANKSAPFHENACLGPYVFYDVVDGLEHHGKHSGSLSLYNESEVKAAVVALKLLKKRYPSEFTSGKIGIITPYRSQLSLIRKQFSNSFGPNVISDMEFNTVDGFQGREVDILVLSTVRASDSSAEEPTASTHGIGFVADVRRMNVALTRARLALWIFGNARTLQTNFHWAALIQNAKERNLFITVKKPYQSICVASKLESHSSHPSVGPWTKDDTLEVQHRRRAVKERHGSKVKCITRETEMNKTSSLDDNCTNNPKGKESSITDELQSTKFSSKNVELVKNKMSVSNGKFKGIKSQNQKDEVENAGDTSQIRPMLDTLGKNSTQVDVQSGVDSSIKNLINKAKGAHGSSGQARGCTLKQRSSTLPSSDGRKKAIKESDRRSSNPEDAPRDSIASRKRQCDAVDDLLSSSLIPSKKSKVSSKPAPVRKLPLEAATRGTKKPSR